MQSIAFTDKTEHIYARFQDMRRAYEDAHGRTYAPGFLTVLMDGYLLYKEIHDLQEMDRLVEGVSLRSYIADAESNDLNLQPENETE